MKILNVFGSVPQVIRRLQLFLNENSFSSVSVNPVSNEITAERKVFPFRKDYIHLKVKQSKDNIANIELQLNPYHQTPTSGDESKELNLQSKLYLYF